MNRATELNFIRQGARIRWWHALLLLAALALLLGWGQRWSQQQQHNLQLQQELNKIEPVTVAPVRRSVAEQQELENRARVIGEAVRQLNLPVATLFKTLQPPKDVRVALLGVDLNAKAGAISGTVGAAGAAGSAGAAGVLKIQAEAPDAAQMMAYVAFLDEQPLFKSVYLIKHEVSAASGVAAYRFLLEAQWRQ